MNPDLEAALVRDLDGVNKPGTIHNFRPEWMKNPERIERGKKMVASKASKRNFEEKAKQDADRQKALESLDKVKEELRVRAKIVNQSLHKTIECNISIILALIDVLLKKSVVYHSACVIFMNLVYANLGHFRQNFNNHVYSRFFV